MLEKVALHGPGLRALIRFFTFLIFVLGACGTVRGQTVTVICPQPIQVQCARVPVEVVPITVTVCNTAGAPVDVLWSVNGTVVETNTVPSLPPPGCSNVTYHASLPPGNHTVSVQVVGAGAVWGNCSIPVTVALDNQPPVLQCPTLLTNVVNKDCVAEVPRVEVVVSDNCAPPGDIVVWQVPAYGTWVPVGTNWITVYAQDPQGNLATCQVPYVVLDPTPPQVACPGPLILDADANCQAVMPQVGVTISDDCTPLSLMTILQTPAPGTVLGAGNHPVTITVTDSSGHTVTCQTTVTIPDLTPPQLNCPGNITLTAGPDCSAVLPALNLTALDGCDGTNVVVSQSPAAGTLLPLGAHTVTVNACDTSGNCSSCTVLVTVVPAVTGPWDWAAALGSTNVDVGRGVTRLPNGDVAVVGDFSAVAQVGTTTLASSGGRDIFVARFTSVGSLVWAVRAGGPNDDYGRGITSDSSGNLYVCGYVSGNALFGSIPATGYFGYVAKLDGAGNWLWVQPVAPANGDLLRIRAQNNRLVVAGWFMGTFTLPGVGTLTSAGGADALVVALDTSGNPLWAWTAGDAGTDAAHDVAFTPTGDVCVTGPFGVGAPHAVNFGGANLTTFGGQDVFVVRLAPNGALLWATNAGGLSDDIGTGVAVDGTGRTYVTGDFKPAAGSNTAQFGATTLTIAGNQNIFVTQLDANGQFLWATNAGGGYFDFARAIAVTALGESYVAGHTWNGTFGSQTVAGTGSEAFVARLNPSGQFTDVWSAGGPGDDGANDVALGDLTGCVFVTGLFRTGPAQFPPGTSLPGAGLDDAFVARLCTGCGSNTPPAVLCPAPLSVSCVSTAGSMITLSVTVGDAEGDPLTVVWLGNNLPVQTNLVPAGPAPTQTTVNFTGQFPPGTNLVTVLVTDAYGGSGACTVPVVLVPDTTPPQVLCKKTFLKLTAGTNCAAILPALAPHAMSDNCTPPGQLVVTQNPPAGTPLGPGIHGVTVTVTDAAGNSASCIRNVLVLDTTPPMIQCPPPLLVTNCLATIPDLTALAVATDNCDPNPGVTQLPAPGTVVGPGVYQLVLTATDASGNGTSCVTPFTVLPPGNPIALPLFPTGTDASGSPLPYGNVDPHYTLIQSADPNAPGPNVHVNPYQSVPQLTWASEWICPAPPLSFMGTVLPHPVAPGVYRYRYTFNLSAPSCVITGRWAVADAGTILLNGQPTGISLNGGSSPFSFLLNMFSWHPFQITSGFVPGQNLLEFVVTNYGAGPTYSGIRVEWAGWVNPCPTTCIPPFLVQHPAAQSVPWGSYAVFSVMAGGSLPLHYQWLKNGVPLPGANGPTLTIQPVTFGHQGAYAVVISNACGVVTSQWAHLLVKAKKPDLVGAWLFRHPSDPFAAEVGEPMEFLPSPEFERQPDLASIGVVSAFSPCPPPPEQSPFCDGFYAGRGAPLLRINPWYDGSLRVRGIEKKDIWRPRAGATAVMDLWLEDRLEDPLLLWQNPDCEGTNGAVILGPGGSIEVAGRRVEGILQEGRSHRIVLVTGEDDAGTVRYEIFVDGQPVLGAGGRTNECSGPNLRMNKIDVIKGFGRARAGRKVYLGGLQLYERALSPEEVRELGSPADGLLELVEVPAVERPHLDATVVQDGPRRLLRLQWSGSGYLLEEADHLTPGGPGSGWRPSLLPVRTVGASGPVWNEVLIPLDGGESDSAGALRFYRLRATLQCTGCLSL